MLNSLEKNAAYACELLNKRAAEESTTYAGEGLRRGIIGGAAAGIGTNLYGWATSGIKPGLKTTLGRGIATAGLWGMVGGLGGGLMKRKPQEPQYQGYYQ